MPEPRRGGDQAASVAQRRSKIMTQAIEPTSFGISGNTQSAAVNPYRYLRFCGGAGLLYLAVTILCWGVLGHNIPPYSAELSAEEFAAAMIANRDQIRLGMSLQLMFSPLYLIWGVAISKVMERVEIHNNVLSTLQIWTAGFTTLVFVLPCSVWLAIVYRPEEMQPQILQMFYDFAWLWFDMGWALTTMGMTAMSVCFLSDRRSVPLVPAWVCWLTIAVGVSFILELFMPFMKGGAFSRSGLINYWIEFGVYFVYWLVTAIYILKAIGRLERERAAGSAT
jgi:uncharacterized membrane protein (DUF485 family)